MTVEVSRDTGRTVITLTATFDGDAAARLRSLLRSGMPADRNSSIVVDFTRVREVSPVALAALVEDFGQLRSRVRFRGLSMHANRILTHLMANTVTA